MPTRICSRCGQPCEGGANPACIAGGAHHWDRATYEKQEADERKKIEAERAKQTR